MTRSTRSLPPHVLLVEPSPRSRWWLSAIYGRLRAVDEGCIVVRKGKGKPSLLDARRLRLVHEEAPSLPGIGSSLPRLLIVGDRLSRKAPFPFFSRSGYHLWAALRVLGFDELGVRLVNARHRDGTTAREDVEKLLGVLGDAPVLVLGAEARRVVERADLVDGRFVFADHPQHHARFHVETGPHGYAHLLERAGLTRVGDVLLPPIQEISDDQMPEIAAFLDVPFGHVLTYPDGAGWPPAEPGDVAPAVEEASEKVREVKREKTALERLAAVATATAGHALKQIGERVARKEMTLTFEQTIALGNLATRLSSAQGDEELDTTRAAFVDAEKAVQEILGG